MALKEKTVVDMLSVAPYVGILKMQYVNLISWENIKAYIEAPICITFYSKT